MKGTSPSQARGEVFTASLRGAKMEIPINIINHRRGEVMNKITTVALPETTVSIIGMEACPFRTSLGPPSAQAGSYPKAHGPEICQPLPHAR